MQKKNLGHWLTAASRERTSALSRGADVIALRKVDVEATDYAQREYGVSRRARLRLWPRLPSNGIDGKNAIKNL